MSKMMTRELVADQAIVHASMPEVVPVQHTVDRTFGLPKRLHALTALAYLGTLGVFAITLANPGLIIPIAICVVFVAMFFGVTFLWERMGPENDSRSQSWSAFKAKGIETATGKLAAKDATIQVLILPVLIFAWAIAIAIIRASVG